MAKSDLFVQAVNELETVNPEKVMFIVGAHRGVLYAGSLTLRSGECGAYYSFVDKSRAVINKTHNNQRMIYVASKM